MRATTAVLFVALTACGADRDDPSLGPTPAAPSPRHPSGASEEDVALLRWLQTTGADLNERVNDACFALSQCTNLSPPGVRGAPERPDQMAGCIDERLRGCEQAVTALESAQVPAPFAAPLATAAHRGRLHLCGARAARQLLTEHPEVTRRLRAANRNLSPAMREHVTGWEALEVWARDHERIPWARDFREATIQCAGQFDAAGGNWGDLTRWLRQRFFCGHLGCCTLDRVAELHDRGEEPGPPDHPTCRGQR